MARLWLALCTHAALVFILYAISSQKNQPAKKVTHALKKKPLLRSLAKDLLVQRFYSAENKQDSPEAVRPISICSCSKIYDPVCASNNKSYFNPCQMDCEAKIKNETIHIMHQGSCIPY